MPEIIDALICPRWTVTIEPHVTAAEGFAVAVDGGRIKAIMPQAEARARFVPRALHERADHVLMPGLVNAHCHAGMTLFRGYADDLPLPRWLKEHIWPAESRWVDAESVRDGTRLAIAEMLRAGTTCFADMYYFPDVVAQTAVDAGMRVAVGMIVIELPTVWASTVDEYIAKGLATRDRFKGVPLVSTTFAPHAPYTTSDTTLRRIRQLADELDVPIHTHLHETRAEVEDAVRDTGRRPLARLAQLGLLTPALLGVHATELLDEEIEALAGAGASIVHCPRSNLKLASGVCPVAALLDAGVNVALGTDGAASNNRLDLWSELDTAALLGKWVANDATAVSAPAALRMATINGARALGLEREIGSIEAGKAADLICVSMNDVALQPVLDPLSHLVYAASREHVSDVWVAGEHLVADGRHTRLDVAEVSRRAAHWAERLLSEPRTAAEGR